MRSRWFHVPILHVPRHGVEKKVTWLELFYDLIFVAAFIQLGNGLSADVSVEGLLSFGGMFAPLWISWSGFSYYANRFTVDDFIHRLLVFLQIFAVGAMAVTAEGVLAGNPRLFGIAYAVAQGVVALLYLRAWRHVPDGRAYSLYWGGVFAAGTVVTLIGGLLPSPAGYVSWGVAVGLVLFAPLSRQSRALAARYPIDDEHLSERFGLLTIIVLGESFVKVVGALSRPDTGWLEILQASMTLLLTCSIWWIYFDDVGGSRIRRQRFAPVVWLYAHLPLQIAITATGVGIKKAIAFDLLVPAPAGYRWLLAGSLAATMLAVGIIDSVTERRQAELSDRARVNARLASAALMLLLAPAGRTMSAGLFLGLVAALTAGQVVFDMMMAPYELAPAHAEQTSVTTAELTRRRDAGDATASPGRAANNLSDILRRGTPAELRRDVYFYFMEGTWKRFLGALLFLYAMTNVFFATLYALEPGCVANARPDSFADAFFFSVQTMSTIGYGALAPATDYGNMIVTFEAASSMLFVALATGLMFAKASRPKASALFSKVCVLTRRHGKRTLMFRVGNARGNEVVDATITVTALKDEISPEGHHLRRMFDVPLVRGRSPMFALSWTVMHELDDTSPLANVDWSRGDAALGGLVVTLTGHDGTYGQTIYARHSYYADDVRLDQRFVDVISRQEDGRMVIDYGKFHDTIPDDGPRS
jgi:inward rectifier potassium channel